MTIRTALGAQRYNARMDKIWARARELAATQQAPAGLDAAARAEWELAAEKHATRLGVARKPRS